MFNYNTQYKQILKFISWHNSVYPLTDILKSIILKIRCYLVVDNIKWKFLLFQVTISHTAKPGNSGFCFLNYFTKSGKRKYGEGGWRGPAGNEHLVSSGFSSIISICFSGKHNSRSMTYILFSSEYTVLKLPG